MSDRLVMLESRVERVAALAAQLGREDLGRYRSLEEIARDAATLIAAGDAARRAIQAGRSPSGAYARAKRVAKLYGATVESRGDTRGMVLGLRFSSGRFSSGADHVFYVA